MMLQLKKSATLLKLIAACWYLLKSCKVRAELNFFMFRRCTYQNIKWHEEKKQKKFLKCNVSGNPHYGWLKVTESYPSEFVLHVSYLLLLISIHVIAASMRLPMKCTDWPVLPIGVVFNSSAGWVTLGRSSWYFCTILPRWLMYKIM